MRAFLTAVEAVEKTTSSDPSRCEQLCGGCAFRDGTDANHYTPTQLKVRLCLETGEAFYCHENKNADGNPLICAGYLAARAARSRWKKVGEKGTIDTSIAALILEAAKG